MERNNLCACVCVLMGGGCVFVIGYAGMPILLSFFVCLSCECIFSCFYQTPSLLCLSLLASLCMCVYLCVRVCLCLSMSFFPSLPSSFLSRLLSRSFFLSLSLTLAVSIFGETQQERQRVKSFLCPALSCCLLFSITGSNWLLSLSFFTVLVIHTHSRRIISTCSRFHRCVHKPQETI